MIGAKDLTVVIPTVFRPPTFQGLYDSAKASGVEVVVVEKMTTNRAYNKGIFEAKTRYVILATDDIVVFVMGNRPWPLMFCRHFADGDSWVGAPPVAGLQRNFDGDGPRMLFRNTGGHVRGAIANHRGHLFAVDKEVDSEPIPEDLVLYYGDDWFFWRHHAYGTTCLALDIGYATGREVQELNQPNHASGWTHGQPDYEAFLGRPVEEQSAEDREAAGRYFVMNGGSSCGLLRADHA